LAGAGVAAAGAAAAAGGGLFFMAGVCDQAAPVANNETALAKIKHAAIRIFVFLYRDRPLRSAFAISRPKPS